MVQALNLFERKAHQWPGAVKEGERSVRIPMNPDRCPDIMEAVPVRRNLQAPAFKLNAVVVSDSPFKVLTEDLVQRLSSPGDKGGSFFRSRMDKLGIEGRTIDRVQIPVGLFHGGDPHQGQLMGKPSLMGPESPFASSPGLGGISRNHIDPQMLHHPSELGEVFLVHLAAGVIQ